MPVEFYWILAGGCLAALLPLYLSLRSLRRKRLLNDLVETEQRIALAREYFNTIATHYNTRMEEIPDRFVSNLLGLKRRDLLVAADFERAAIQVNLSD